MSDANVTRKPDDPFVGDPDITKDGTWRDAHDERRVDPPEVIAEQLGIIDIGRVLDGIQEHLVQAREQLIKLRPVTEEDTQAIGRVTACISQALGGVTVLVPRLPEQT